MLQTIEVEIDPKGHINPLEKLPLPQQGQVVPAFGALAAPRSVSLDEMETAIHARGSRL